MMLVISRSLKDWKLCAAVLVRILAGQPPETPTLVSNCYSVVAPDYAIALSGSYRPADGQYMEVEGSSAVSPLEAVAAQRAEEAKKADAWFRTTTAEIFG